MQTETHPLRAALANLRAATIQDVMTLTDKEAEDLSKLAGLYETFSSVRPIIKKHGGLNRDRA